MDPNKLLVNLFCIILSIRFSLAVEFCFRFILINSQSNVNIMIDTKITSNELFAYFKSNKTD